jgi:putative exosortase-associated protein (TIGR04073 family)
MKKIRNLAIASSFALMMLAAPGAHAEGSAAQKLGRGFAGMTLGILELPGNIYKETKANGVAGLPVGMAYGFGMIVSRELVGVYEFITAPFPIPADFRPILKPDYPWDYFRGTTIKF